MRSDNVGIAIGVLGLLPLLQAAFRWYLRRRPRRRLLGASLGTPLEIVVTTNEIQRQEPGVADAYLTAIGEVRGVRSISHFLSTAATRRKVEIFIADEYAGNPRGDLVLLGGPRRNSWSRHFLRRLNRELPVEVALDAEDGRIRIGDLEVTGFDQQRVDGVPTEDLGLVVLAPWAQRGQRVVLCGGLSTYGTEAAARFIFEDIFNDRKLVRRILRMVKSNDVVAIGVHAFVAGRNVQRTDLFRMQGREFLWSGSRSPIDGPAPARATDSPALAAGGDEAAAAAEEGMPTVLDQDPVGTREVREEGK